MIKGIAFCVAFLVFAICAYSTYELEMRKAPHDKSVNLGMTWFFTIIFLIALTVSSFAHSWYPSDCCNGDDCNPVPCDTLDEQEDGGYVYKPENKRFTKQQVRPSQDSKCHVCISPKMRTPYCVFILQST